MMYTCVYTLKSVSMFACTYMCVCVYAYLFISFSITLIPSLYNMLLFLYTHLPPSLRLSCRLF